MLNIWRRSYEHCSKCTSNFFPLKCFCYIKCSTIFFTRASDFFVEGLVRREFILIWLSSVRLTYRSWIQRAELFVRTPQWPQQPPCLKKSGAKFLMSWWYALENNFFLYFFLFFLEINNDFLFLFFLNKTNLLSAGMAGSIQKGWDFTEAADTVWSYNEWQYTSSTRVQLFCSNSGKTGLYQPTLTARALYHLHLTLWEKYWNESIMSWQASAQRGKRSSVKNSLPRDYRDWDKYVISCSHSL